MFYTKNLPGWERILRLAMGLLALGFSYANWGQSTLGASIGIMGAMLSVTGLIGFCPMCAMVGRKLDKGN